MAAVTYRCSVDPDGCREYTEPGFCERHSLRPLRPHRTYLAAKPADPTATSADPGATPPATRPAIAVFLLDRVIEVPADGLLIGREEGPLSALPGMTRLEQVSRRHARLYWVGDVLYVTDLQSMNGTFVDGQRVETAQRIAPGQALRLGLDVDVQLRQMELDEFGLPR